MAMARQNTARGETLKRDASLRKAMAVVEAGETVSYNSAICAFVGPGGAGKTSTRLAIQDIEQGAQRVSTVGGDRADLQFVDVHLTNLVGLRAVEHGSCVERAVAHAADTGHTTHAGASAATAAVSAHTLAQLVDGSGESFAGRRATGWGMQHPLVAMGPAGSGVAATSSSSTGSSIAVSCDAMKDQRTGSTIRTTAWPFDPADGEISNGGARKRQAATEERWPRTAVVDSALEPIMGQQVLDMMMRRLQEGGSSAGGDGTHVTFLDMGGQSEFWQIIGSFLRNQAIITVFGRLDEIHHNITTGEQLPDKTSLDSDLLGLEEVLMWLDVITACTADGPVMIALSHADVVTDPKMHQTVSE